MDLGERIDAIEKELKILEAELEEGHQRASVLRADLYSLRRAEAIISGNQQSIPKTRARANMGLPQRILLVVAKGGGLMALREIKRKLALDGVVPETNSLFVAIQRLIEQGQIVRTGRGIYALPHQAEYPSAQEE